MTNNNINSYFSYQISACLVGMIATGILSWIGDVYEWGVQNLFSADGIRWAVVNFIPNLRQVPLAETILLMIAVGVLSESGLPAYFLRSEHSLKQRRAMTFSLVTLATLLVFTALLIYPSGVLLSAFGTLNQSPFIDGLVGLILLLLITTGNVYAFLSGRFVTSSDIIDGNAAMLRSGASCILAMCISAEFVSCLDFTRLLSLASDNPVLPSICRWTLYVIPFSLASYKYLFSRS